MKKVNVILQLFMLVLVFYSCTAQSIRGALSFRRRGFLPKLRYPHVGLNDLVEVPIDFGNFTSKPINNLKEDHFQPGSFLFSIGAAIMRYTPSEPITVIVGDPEQSAPYRFQDGPVAEASFSLIGDFVQYNETKLIIADFLFNCIREYNSDTRTVSTILGVCERYSMETSPIRAGQVVPSSSRFIVGPMQIQHVRSGNYLIIYDFGYEALTRFDFDTQTARLLSDNHNLQLPNIRSLLVNEQETFMYVSHSYGVSKVNLNTLEVTRIIGETVHDRGYNTRPLTPGPFVQASVGILENLRWIHNDQVMVGSQAKGDEGLAVLDLDREVLSSYCVGNAEQNMTTSGDSATCQLNAPTALTVANRKIYVATLTEGNIDSYRFNSESSLFSADITSEFCTIDDMSRYENIRPRRPRFRPFETVRVRCRFQRHQNLQCVRSNSDPNSYHWSKSLPICNV